MHLCRSCVCLSASWHASGAQHARTQLAVMHLQLQAFAACLMCCYMSCYICWWPNYTQGRWLEKEILRRRDSPHACTPQASTRAACVLAMSRALRQHECSMRRHERSMRQHPLPHHAACMLPSWLMHGRGLMHGFAVELPRLQSSIRYRIMPDATDACTRAACVATVEGVAAACARCDA